MKGGCNQRFDCTMITLMVHTATCLLLSVLFLLFFLEPPPSYQSLFGEIQSARQSSSSTMDFMKKLSSLLAETSK